MSNHLKYETSPYLLQHAENPVDWYPWCEEAFRKAESEDKPIFLSIGYSTCHWCHVMARESFSDSEIAEILNRYFVSIKVDKEERPDIDSVYMTVCQAFTGSGGWPASIFMTAGKEPFFAGTYFPKTSRYGSIGFKELLLSIHSKWENDRDALLRPAEELAAALRENRAPVSGAGAGEELPERAVRWYRQNFDAQYGGFGGAPKFPTPHNLLFLMQQYAKHGVGECLNMAEVTLRQMYAGGLFDHVGYGFCRYSTDRMYLVPHFEKMLYDNALLILAYCRAHGLTGESLYLDAAVKTAEYVLHELSGPEGGFYSAQDADSDGEEGKYYVFTPAELTQLLGDEDGAAFCERFDITPSGNFHGKSIPNLLRSRRFDGSLDALLPAVREYRRQRSSLATDDKILTAWNSLMIAALCSLYRCTGDRKYLEHALCAQEFIEAQLCCGDTLYVSFRENKRGESGFLDDYASYIFALLSLYDATLSDRYLSRAQRLLARTVELYFDAEHGGFYLYGKEHEELLFRPKDCYDGAVPSGNSLMAFNLVRLDALVPDGTAHELLERQLDYMSGEAAQYPAGYAMFLIALSDYFEPPVHITVVPKDGGEDFSSLPLLLPPDAAVRVLPGPSEGYALLHGGTAFYVCRGHSCLPPMDATQFTEFISREKAAPAEKRGNSQ